jgi:predicted transcriptional regulator
VEQEILITLTADIVSAHVSNNSIAVGDVGNLVERVHQALAALGQTQEEAPVSKSPAVSVRSSVKPDYIVCMVCGAKQKTLKRHLQSAHGLTPGQYRADYGLPASYPMTSPNYSKRRGDMARAIGLGQKGRRKANGGQEGAPPAKPRGRKRKVSAEG